MKPRYTPKPQRTQADKKAEAINFVWYAMDHVIRQPALSGASIALMKGVTKADDIAEIDAQLVARRTRPRPSAA